MIQDFNEKVNILAERVTSTYFSRLSELSLTTQFHFNSRTYSWSNNLKAKENLLGLQAEFMPATQEERAEVLKSIIIPKEGAGERINAYEVRLPYFEKYPLLRPVNLVLFRLRHWLHIYGVDERELLFAMFSKEDIDAMYAALLKDTEALKFLSTYAVNFIYLYHNFMGEGEGEGELDMNAVLELSQEYDLTNPLHAQLLQYLYTHCIIADSLFYYQPVTEYNLPIYIKMLEQIDDIIELHGDRVSLDNKFEFLVCAKICGYIAKTEKRIRKEALRSVRKTGYITDKHNNNPAPSKATFRSSEHRNVLFVMSTTEPLFNQEPVR